MERFNHNLGSSKILKSGELRFLSISKIIILIIFSISFLLISCDKELKVLVAPDENEFPGSPINVKAVVADGSIIITWGMSATVNIHCYHIYRKDSVSANMGLIDSSVVMKYVDNNVKNGNKYYYQIVAVNNKGYEGKRSSEVSANPNLFGVIIQNGDEFTNNRSVTLSLTAPIGTQSMSIANDSGFVNSSWENYTSIKIWTLTSGDGPKYVYVKFRDYDGKEPNRIFDIIILDTKAVINTVTENTNGQTKVPGQNIHFTLDSKEQEGKATIDIGNVATGIKLYDDGTNNDTQANDGIYEVEYPIPSGLQIVNAIVTGHFTDRANNVAEVVTALGRVTIQQDPLAVKLYPPVTGGAGVKSLELYWSESTDNDFSSYRLFRKTSPGVDTTSTLITTITNKATINYNDQTAKENTDYYYRVFVFDKFGRAKGSNEEKGRIDFNNENPSPVKLLSPVAVGNSLTSLTLTWSKNSDDDFESYRIYRAEAPEQVDSTSFVANIIYTQDTVRYVDTGLKENTEYNYQVYVFDTGGKFVGSNKVSGKTGVNAPPTAVTLLTPTSVGNSITSLTLNWSKNVDEDFASYRIYRAEAPTAVDLNSFVVDIIYNQNTTAYQDNNLKENTEYNYRIYVFDTGSNSTGSNTVTGKTNINNPPTAVTLLTPTPVMNSLTSLNLSWSKNEDLDFESYRIYRAESPQEATTTSFLVDVLYDQNVKNYQDTNLKENTEYNYRLYVFDSGGKSTPSNMVTGKTNLNNPPNAVNLLTPTPVMNSLTSLNLLWSKNEDLDFESYRIYRAESPQEVNTTSFLVNVLYTQNTTTYQDNNLKENTQYNYRVYVFDNGGKSTPSNMVTGKTNENTPPTAVTLLPPVPVANSLISLALSWSINEDVDFASYRIYRAESPQDVNTNSFLVNVLNNQGVTNYQDTNLKEDTQYNYRVYVFDTGGKSTGSNMVTGKTNVNDPPTPVTLLTPIPVNNSTSSLNLSWSKNVNVDFASYIIYRADAPDAVDSNSFVVDVINNQSTTNYQDTNLKENTEYNYRIYVFDQGGKSTGSNTAKGKTNANLPPNAVFLAQPVVFDSTTLQLNWTQNNDLDFQYYKIYRSETTPVDISGGPITIIGDPSVIQYYDANLTTNKTYHYRIVVTDLGGLSSGSNEASGTPKP